MPPELYLGGVTVVFIGGMITTSVRYHLGITEWNGHEARDDLMAHIVGTILGAGLWPLVMGISIALGFCYLGHKGIGCIMKRPQQPKPTPKVWGPGTVDPDLLDAEREVEEICSEAHG